MIKRKPEPSELEEISKKLSKIEKLWKMDEKDKRRVLRITGLLASVAVEKKGNELNKAIKKVRELGDRLDDEISVLQLEAQTLPPREAEGIREELDEVSTGKSLKLVEELMKKTRPGLRKYISDLLAMRVLPIYVRKPYTGVRLTTPAEYKGEMRKPNENPAYQLDSYLLRKVASHIGPALFVVPAFSLEHDFADYGHLVAITPSERYLPKPSERIIPLKKKAQELTEEEIEKLKEKTGQGRVVLVVKGINSILNPKEMEELVRKTNPEYIAVYGTWHEERPNFDGVPKIDENTIELIKKLEYEDVTGEIFKKDELKKIEELERRIRMVMEPWAKYFPATRVKVFRRRRI